MYFCSVRDGLTFRDRVSFQSLGAKGFVELAPVAFLFSLFFTTNFFSYKHPHPPPFTRFEAILTPCRDFFFDFVKISEK